MNILGVAAELGATLDQLGIDYAVGGSVASSFFGEPRSTLDVDIAVRGATSSLRQLLDEVAAEFYVPVSAAEAAIESFDSFNLLHHLSGLKVDIFVLGDEEMDRRQIERRIRVETSSGGLWVTSPEDIVLRKLWWYSLTDESSGRQWRDVIALFRSTQVDTVEVLRGADDVGLEKLARRAIDEASGQA